MSDTTAKRTTASEDAAPILTETPEELAYELRAAEASIWTGTRLLLGIGIFSLASLAFAYFYLRSNNNENLWKPHGLSAPTGLGAAVMAFGVTAAVLAVLAVRRLRAGQMVDWQVAGWATVGVGLITIGLQVYEQTQLPFFPGASGYSSCYVGWAVLNIVMLLGAVYWSETALARFIRLQRAFTAEGGEAASPIPSVQLLRASLDGAATFWIFVAVAEVFFWLLFYVI